MTKFFSKHRNHIAVLVIVGIAVYFIGLFNGFAWDDYPFILDNPLSYNFDFMALIGPNVFNSGLFYRPIPSLYFAGLYTLFGDQAFFYHLIQIILHTINTVMVFGFFTLFFPEMVALFLALIFLVHPINTESVAFINATISDLYFFFGMAGFLIGVKQHLSYQRILLVFGLMLLSVLTKETGFLFLPLLVLYRYLYKLDSQKILAFCTVLLAGLYVAMRIAVGGVLFSASTPFIAIRDLSLVERLVMIPSIMLHYIITFVFPWKLSIWQIWVKTLSIQGFFIPLMICMALVASIGWYIKNLLKTDKKKFRTALFFVSWYVVGMALIVQIVPLNMTVAERWFYFPILGVLGIVGVVIEPYIPSFKKLSKKHLIVGVAVLTLLSARTVIRILDWKDHLTVLTHDASVDSQNPLLLDELGLALHKEGRTDEALPYGVRSVALAPNVINLNHLGTMYFSTQQYDKAINAYSRAIAVGKPTTDIVRTDESGLVETTDVTLLKAYINLSTTYHMSNKPKDTVRIAEEGITIFPESGQLYLYVALGAYKLGDREKALEAIQKSYELSPTDLNAYIYNQLKQGLPVQGI